MPVSHNTSLGRPMYHYTNNVLKEKERLGYQPMTRHKRRKLERKLRKKVNKYLNSSNYDNY